MTSDSTGRSKASVDAQACAITSAGRCVISGAGPRCAARGAAAASRAAVQKARVGRGVRLISLLGPVPNLLRGEGFELFAGIGEILAALELLHQPVVVRDRFRFLIGLEERFRQIVVNGVPLRVIGVLLEDFPE